MNKNVQFFITACLLSFSLYASSDRPLTLVQSILVGGVVGAAEVALPGQLLSYGMNCAIKKELFVPSHSYRGFVANAGGQMPITAMQKVVQVKGSQAVEYVQDSPLTDRQKVGVSLAAGVAGAVIDTPCNAMQLYLQKPENAGKSNWQAAQALGRASYRGFLPNAALKEGPFAVGYQVLAPKGKEFAQKYVEDSTTAAVVGSAGAGVVTAVVTHPGAVLRNKMQGDFGKKMYTTTMHTAQKIFEEEGVQGLFRGLPQRGTRVAVAIPLYVGYGAALEAWMKKE